MNTFFIKLFSLCILSCITFAMDVPGAPTAKRRKLAENSYPFVASNATKLASDRVPSLKNLAARVVAAYETDQYMLTDDDGHVMRRHTGEPVYDGLGSIDQHVHDQIIEAKRAEIKKALEPFEIPAEARSAKIVDTYDERIIKVRFISEDKLLIESKTRMYDIIMGSVYISRIQDLKKDERWVINIGDLKMHAMSTGLKRIIYEHKQQPWLIKDINLKEPDIEFTFPAGASARFCRFDDSANIYALSYYLDGVGYCSAHSLDGAKSNVIWRHSLPKLLCSVVDINYPHLVFDSDNPNYKRSYQSENNVPLNDFNLVNLKKNEIVSFSDPKLMDSFYQDIRKSCPTEIFEKNDIWFLQAVLIQGEFHVALKVNFKSGNSRYFVAAPRTQKIIPLDHRQDSGTQVSYSRFLHNPDAIVLIERERSGSRAVALFDAANGKCTGRISLTKDRNKALVNKSLSLAATYKKDSPNLEIHPIAQPDSLKSEHVFMAFASKNDSDSLECFVKNCNMVDSGLQYDTNEGGGNTQQIDF